MPSKIHRFTYDFFLGGIWIPHALVSESAVVTVADICQKAAVMAVDS